MARLWRIALQAVCYAACAGLIGYFSLLPSYRPLPAGQAMVKLTIRHAGQPVAECRQRSPAELAALPPNMRVATQCARERSPVTVRLEWDGAPLYQAVLPPSGLSGDGAASDYRRFVVPAGMHRLRAELADSVREPRRVDRLAEEVRLEPGRVLVVDYRGEQGGWVFR